MSFTPLKYFSSFRALPVQEEALLLRIELEGVLLLSSLQFLQPTNLLPDGLEVREHPAEPPLGDEEGTGALRFLFDDATELALGANEKHTLSLEHHLPHRLLGPVEPVQGLAEIDDVDAVALREDEPLHLRIPTAGLVSEMDTCLEQFVQFNLLHVGAGLEFTAC